MNYCTSMLKEATKKVREALQLRATPIEEKVVEKDVHVSFNILSYGGGEHSHEYKAHWLLSLIAHALDLWSTKRKKKPYLACENLYFVFFYIFGLFVYISTTA